MKRKKNWKRIAGWFLGTGILILAAPVAYAVEVEYYLKNAAYFKTNDIISNVFRAIGWWGIKLLKALADACQDLYGTMFSFLDFTTWGELGTFLDSFQPVVVAIMCGSLIALGIMMIATQKKETKIFQNIVLAIFVLSASSMALTNLNQLLIAGKDAVLEEMPNSSTKIIESNFWSLPDIDQRIGLKNLNAEGKENESHPHIENLTDEDIAQLDPNQTQNFNSDLLTEGDSKGEDGILGQRIHFYGGAENGKYEIVKVKNGYGWNSKDDEDFGNTFYYRFRIGWFSIYTELGALVIVFLCLAYKVFRIVWEITFGRILAYFYAAELSGGQKLIKILCGIRDNYITLFFTLIMIKVYELLSEFIAGSLGDQVVVKGIAILFLAFCTMDGPNLIEKVTGVDAGLKSGWGKLIAGMAAMRGMAGLATAPGRWKDTADRRSLQQSQKAYYGKLNERLDGQKDSGEETKKPGQTGDAGSKDGIGGTAENRSRKQGESGASSTVGVGTSAFPEEQKTDTEQQAPLMGMREETQQALNGFDPQPGPRKEIDSDMQKMRGELSREAGKTTLQGSSGLKERPTIYKEKREIPRGNLEGKRKGDN